MKYRLSKEAVKDLENIWLHTFENWSVEQADRYLNLIFDEIKFVSENPLFGTNYDHIREGYFRTRVNSHFVFYKLSTKGELIDVIRVLHQQVDIDERLLE